MSAASQRRVKKLFGTLTATERAVHIIQSWKEGRDAEKDVRSSTPPEQMREVNDLLATAKSVNREFGFVIMVAAQAAEKHRLRWAWLQTLRAWSLCADSIRRELVLAVPEYITEEERDRRVVELGGEEWTLEEAAQHLADVDESQDLRGWKAALLAGIADGSLVATGKGKAQRIRYSDLCSWRGEEVPVIPEWGFEAEVHPNEGTVAMRREAMDTVRQFLAAAPGANALADSTDDESPLNASVLALETTLREEVPSLWQELQAVDVAVAEVRERLGGEDPLDPDLRRSLSDALECLADLAERLGEDRYVVELDGPPDDEVHKYREVLRSFVEQETGW